MSIAFILRTLVFRMKHKASWCCWSHGQRFQIVEWPELSNILCFVTKRIVVGLRFVFHTSVLLHDSSLSISKFPCRIGVWNDRAGWFFSADLPPSTPMSTTSKVKCHGMICELRRSLGPLRHKTYEPLRLKGWRELWGPQLGMSWVKGKYQTSRPDIFRQGWNSGAPAGDKCWQLPAWSKTVVDSTRKMGTIGIFQPRHELVASWPSWRINHQDAKDWDVINKPDCKQQEWDLSVNKSGYNWFDPVRIGIETNNDGLQCYQAAWCLMRHLSSVIRPSWIRE